LGGVARLRLICLVLAALAIAVAALGPGAALAQAATDDTRLMDEDDSVVISVLDNDPGFTTHSQISAVSDPDHGTTSIAEGDSDGVSYTPDHDYCNSQVGGSPDTFTYTGDLGTATVSVTVTCLPDNPVANNDPPTPGDVFNVDEDSGPTPFDVLANDTDADGDAIEITSVSPPVAGGTASVVQGVGGARDQVSYTPKPDFCGGENVTYTINGGATATLSIEVHCKPDLPVANDDARTVAMSSGTTFLDVLSNDVDADGDEIPIVKVTQPLNGTASIVQGAADPGQNAIDQIAYTPNKDFCGTDRFSYTVRDDPPNGDIATVTVTVPCPVVSSGAGGSIGAGSVGAPPPLAKASAKAGKIKVKGTALTVPLTCTKAASCTISLGLSIAQDAKASKKKTVVIGKAKVTLKPGQKRTVTVKLNKAGKRTLKKSHKLKAKLKIVLGGKALTTRTVRFKA
jgi:Bacterial Ig domain